MVYPNRQPITSDYYAAAVAARAAGGGSLLPPGPEPRRAARAPLVDRMADDMLRHGEGMTDKDLLLAGYTRAEIDKHGPEANRKARRLAGLN